MEKPKRPIEPICENFPLSTRPAGQNFKGQPIHERVGWVDAYHKYQKELEQYNQEMELYEQIKLIRLVKNSTEKYCLKALKISKK